MANRQESVPFSISFLMKSHNSEAVTTQSLTPPPCFLDGSLTSLLSQDLPRTPECVYRRAGAALHNHENQHTPSVDDGRDQKSDTRRPEEDTEILSPPATPISMTSATSPASATQVRQSPSVNHVPTYTDLSHHTLNPAHGRSDNFPPFSFDVLLGTGSPHLPGHPSYQTSHGSSDTKSTDTPDSSTADPASTVEPMKRPASSKTNRGTKSRSAASKNSVASPDDVSRSKRNRTSYNADQIQRLDDVFLTTPYPDTQLYEMLADEMNIPQKNLKTWFQNKRARSKKKSVDRRTGDKTPQATPNLLPPYPVSMPPALHQYPYAMPGTIMPPPTATSPSSMVTPPPSPNPHQLLKQPVARYPPSLVPMRRSIISPPSGTSVGSSFTPTDHRTPHPHRLSPPITKTDILRMVGMPSQPGPFTGLCHDRLYYAEFRDLHDSVLQDTPTPVYPSMLSALEKLCSSLS